jgi:hypothetical protein
MSGPLDLWLLAADRAPANGGPIVTDVSERCAPPEEVLRYLADYLLACRVSDQLLARVTERIGWQMARDALLRQPVKSIRNGAFGEALAACYLSDLEAYEIPCPKARVQIDPNQTLPGTDLLAIRTQSGQIIEVHFTECKLRTTRHNGAALEAHGQLVNDHEDAFATIIMFTLGRLYETNHPLLDPFLDYLVKRTADDLDTYGIFLVMDEAICAADPLADVIDAAGPLSPLHIRSAQIAGLGPLIANVFDRLACFPVPDSDDAV